MNKEINIQINVAYLFNELFICLCVYTNKYTVYLYLHVYPNKYIYTINNRRIEKWRILFVARAIKNGRDSAWTGFYNCKVTSKLKKAFSAKENFLKNFPIALRNQYTFPAEFGCVSTIPFLLLWCRWFEMENLSLKRQYSCQVYFRAHSRIVSVVKKRKG